MRLLSSPAQPPSPTSFIDQPTQPQPLLGDEQEGLPTDWHEPLPDRVRRLGEQVGLKVRPHGLRHTAITEACKLAQAKGMGLEEVLDFSRRRERNVQGQLATLVAAGVEGY